MEGNNWNPENPKRKQIKRRKKEKSHVSTITNHQLLLIGINYVAVVKCSEVKCSKVAVESIM